MIITCPNCGRRFDLQRRPTSTFTCPKCGFTAPFNLVLNGNNPRQMPAETTNAEDLQPEMQTVPSQPGAVTADQVPATAQEPGQQAGGGETKVVPGLAQQAGGEKTKMVPGLAGGSKTQVVPELMRKRGVLQMSYAGRNYGAVTLPVGVFSFGRNSMDSSAQVKLTPDLAMSRVHGMMKAMNVGGQIVYQVTSSKDSNPVYVNGRPIGAGKACNLKPGDMLKMGETTMVFSMR